MYTFPEEATPLIRMKNMQIQQNKRQSVKRHSGVPIPSSMLGLLFNTPLLYGSKNLLSMPITQQVKRIIT